MIFTAAKSGTGYKIIKQGERGFSFSPDGLTLVNRASFEIDSMTPYEYRCILQECIHRGYIKPVAAIRGPEYTMEMLRG